MNLCVCSSQRYGNLPPEPSVYGKPNAWFAPPDIFAARPKQSASMLYYQVWNPQITIQPKPKKPLDEETTILS